MLLADLHTVRHARLRQSLVRSVGAAALLAFAGGGQALAQDSAEPDVITVTSSAIDVAADEVTGAVEVVDRRHIEDNLAGSIADTIAHEPGVSSSYFGPASSRPVIRGLGSDRVRVLVNGVGLIDASTNSPDHAVASEALEAESVEILRGPAAIAYGGGAIGGVVNVIDGRVPSERAEDGVDGRAYAQFTSVDEGSTAAGRLRFNVGEFTINVEGLTRTADDYDIPGYAESDIFRLFEEAEEDHDHDDEDHDDDDHDEDHDDEHEDEESVGSVENSGLDFSAASAGISWIGENGFFGVSVKTTDARYGIPGGHAHHHDEEDHDDDHDDDDHDDEDHDDEDHDHEDEEGAVSIDMEQVRYDFRGEWRDLGDYFDRVKVSFGVGDYEHVELEGEEIGTQFHNEGWEGRVELRHAEFDVAGGSLEGAVGVQAFSRDFEAIGEEAFVPASETRDSGLFLVERWDRGSWGLEGGLRLETRSLDTATQGRDFDTQSLSGSVFLRPQDSTFLALTLSSSERAPTDVELFAEGPHVATQSFEVGNPDLGVERAHSIELTARTDVGDWELEGSIFRADYDGFIASFATGEEEDGFSVYEYRQEDAVLQGFESRLTGPLGSYADWDLEGELIVEYVDGELDSGGNLPRIPPLSATAGLTASTERHQLRLETEWSDVQNETAVNELKTQSFVLFNARWSVQPFDGRDLRIILEGRNLTDEEARLHTSFLKDRVPLPGRNLRAALVLDF